MGASTHPAGSRVRSLMIVAAVAVCAGLGVYLTGALNSLEHETVAKRFELRNSDPPTDLVVVAVDDKTFADLDRGWPFPRSYFGRVVDRLHAAGAREIVLDVQFTEPRAPREDLALYDSLDRAGGAVLATSETDGHGRTNVLGGDENLAAIDARAAAANLPEDDRGVLRRFRYQEGGLKTIGVAVAERLGHEVNRQDFAGDGAWIDYRGGPGTIPALSFADVLHGRVSDAAVRGKIVVVGTSAPTLHDVHPTPTTAKSLMSGPEVQAHAIWTAINGVPLRDAPSWVNVLLIILLGLAVPLAAVWVRVSVAALAGIGLGLAYVLEAVLLFDQGVIVAMVAPLLTLGLSTVLAISSGYVAEYRERLRMTTVNAMLEDRIRERTQELYDTQLEVIQRLGQAVEWRDEETADHVERMSALCYRLGRAAGMEKRDAEVLRRAAALHDVGKIGVPDNVLRKPGKLNEEEWAQIKRHTVMGAEILSGSKSLIVQTAEEIARTHHERWNGSGYPFGLMGEEIPLSGRICAIADVFDALTSDRPYKQRWSVDDALAELEHQAGREFDPVLIKAFLSLGPDLRREYGEPPAQPVRGGVPTTTSA